MTTVSLTKAWPDVNDRALLQQLLGAANISNEGIAAWTAVRPNPGTSAYSHVVEAMDWITAFDFDAETAAAWSATSIDMDTSLIYAQHGWTPAEADRFHGEVFLLGCRAKNISDQIDWVTAGMPRDFVLECVLSGVADHRDGHRLYEMARSKA